MGYPSIAPARPGHEGLQICSCGTSAGNTGASTSAPLISPREGVPLVKNRTWLLATASGAVLMVSPVAWSVAQTPAAPPPGTMAGPPQLVCDNLDAFLAA